MKLSKKMAANNIAVNFSNESKLSIKINEGLINGL